MNYEIVKLEEKMIVGLSSTTSNDDPAMGQIIGTLWKDFYQGISTKIKNRVNGYSIGLYSDYTQNGYTVTVGNEVSICENNDLTVKIIPAGTYAKFSIEGHIQQSVAKAWSEIWQMDLNRSFTGDFEEYLNSDLENAKINLYIALK